VGSQLAPEGPLQHRREEGVQILRRPGLTSLEPVDLGLEIVEAGDDAALMIAAVFWSICQKNYRTDPDQVPKT
jgi:hypothetical protein